MTLREQQNELFKAEIDRFAERMKSIVDNFERELKVREHNTMTLALELDRVIKENSDVQT